MPSLVPDLQDKRTICGIARQCYLLLIITHLPQDVWNDSSATGRSGVLCISWQKIRTRGEHGVNLDLEPRSHYPLFSFSLQ